ncbi:hypothetical protein F3Y22_tig00110332pilonHSYRG00717 [Hibiscus syriacus]|uniref:Ubiquitin-like protease family profile domain-containing protein n=1 Tax=Hibiscus syriacus TaxID=106335 RepID=A0A6A3AW69_HIBSY|nr:hypothetical protein F3Y22_tig00110332pilonHSYRG00717 [Hibiscus syriacus]
MKAVLRGYTPDMKALNNAVGMLSILNSKQPNMVGALQEYPWMMTGSGRPPSVYDVWRPSEIIYLEGGGALWRGLHSGVARDSVFGGIFFSTRECLHQIMLNWKAAGMDPPPRYDEEIGPLSPLAVSLAAGFSAAAASHGFDTAKSRSQSFEFISMERKLLKWKTPGKRSEKLTGIHPADRNLLFRGIWLRMARSGIASFAIVGSYYFSIANLVPVPSPSLTLYGEIRPHLRRFPSPSPAKSLTTIHSQKSLTIIQKWKINLRGNFFSASLTLRNKVSLATTIASKLSPAQRKLFEETCFGPWLRVQHPGGDANLTHLWLQTMTSDLPYSIQRGEEEIWFHFPPAYTCFGRKEFCLITGLRFGHDDVGRYTRHITRTSWLSRVFPDESIDKPNLHVDDMKKLFNKKDDFTRMNDVDVVRGSYIWKATWTKLSSAFHDRKSLRGDGSKYTLSGFVWAFKIWIFEAFPAMKTYAIKTSNDIPRAISWKRKRLLDWEDLIPYATINNEANIPLMRLTPTEAELATDCWQASQRFLDGTNDEQHPLPPLREPSPHPEPSPDRPDYTPLQREPSPIPSHHRASSPPSPHDMRPAKMPRLLSPCSPPPRDESRELRDEVNALREEIGTLRDNDGAWRVEVYTLRGEVAALREMVVSLQNEVHTLRNERTDKVDALRRVFLAQQSSRIRRRARAIKSPYTPIVRRHRKKKPDSPVIPQESTPIVEDAPIIPRESSPTVQEATVIVEEVSPTIQEPDSHGVICRILEKPSDVPDMMDSSWLSYELLASTIPVSEVERKQLPDTILDNTLWAKTAVDFYLHERSQGCFTDICKLNDDIYLLLDRSWWGVLLGVEDNGYFDGGVFIPVLERNHWLLVELQIPSLKAIVYDIMINYISLADLRDIIKGWSSYLAKFLDAINYWTLSGNKKPKKLNITVNRDETAPQQTKGPRGDCGPLVCLALDRLITRSIKYLPPTDIDRAAVGLWFRHYMARSIYTRRCLPASAL